MGTCFCSNSVADVPGYQGHPGGVQYIASRPDASGTRALRIPTKKVSIYTYSAPA